MIRLKRVAKLVTRGEDKGTLPFVALENVGSGTGLLLDESMTESTIPSSGAALARPGDVLFGRLRPYLAKTWLVDREAYVSTELLCLRPQVGVAPSYLHYIMRSAPLIEWSMATSDGAKMPRTSWDKLADFDIHLPVQQEQRRVADFLDRETARFDALISAKVRMLSLIEERAQATVERRVWWEGPTMRVTGRLRHIARRIDVGIAEAATHAYADHGVPLLRSTNIRRNHIDGSDLLFIAPWFATRNRSKFIHAGDILTVRTGNVGVSAVVPAEFDNSQCFTQLITTLNKACVPSFICFALNSGPARAYFELNGWGSAQANISVPLLANAPVPKVAPADQSRLSSELDHILAPLSGAASLLQTQIELLRERRQTLITAAVTGEFDIPGVAA